MSPVKRARHGLTVTLSPIALAGSLAVLCAGFILVFSLGVMLGRGHNLESNIPELEAIMPERAPGAPPVVVDSGAERPGQVVTVFEGSVSGEPVRAEVIGPAELEYREHLKKPLPSRRTAPEKADQAAKKADSAAKPAAPAKAADNKKVQPAQNAAPGLKPLDKPLTGQAQNTAQSGSENKRYLYVYQIASSRDEAASESYAARLKARGLNVRTEKSESDGSVWYRTVVDFSGTTAEAEVFRERMKEFGIDQPFLKSRK